MLLLAKIPNAPKMYEYAANLCKLKSLIDLVSIDMVFEGAKSQRV